jgi:hypothetical protein
MVPCPFAALGCRSKETARADLDCHLSDASHTRLMLAAFVGAKKEATQAKVEAAGAKAEAAEAKVKAADAKAELKRIESLDTVAFRFIGKEGELQKSSFAGASSSI